MVEIGLIAALPLESNALLHYIRGWKRTRLGAFQGKSFVLKDRSCLLVTSGMGTRRAGEAAQSLIEIYAPRRLISLGIAGAAGADLHIGDVVMAEGVCQLEHEIPGEVFPLVTWPETARQAAADALSKRGARLLPGTAITTGGFQITGDQLTHLQNPILEMETAGIAQVAAANGIPFYSLRAISDTPLASLPFDLSEIMDENANLQIGSLLRILGHHPGLIFEINRFMRNSRLAADHAALALLALSQTW